MSYKCSGCAQKCEGRLIKHVVYRHVPFMRTAGFKHVPDVRKEVEREIPVCGMCRKLLELGVSLREIQQAIARERERAVQLEQAAALDRLPPSRQRMVPVDASIASMFDDDRR